MSNLNANAYVFVPGGSWTAPVEKEQEVPDSWEDEQVEEATQQVAAVSLDTPTGEPSPPQTVPQPDDEPSTPDDDSKDDSPALSDADPDAEKPSSSKKVVVGDEVLARKNHVNVIFCGHVDAGKSTISGHILYLNGLVDKRTLEKYEREAKEMNRESWFYAWALDTGSEERDKGITVEVGRAHFETENKRFTILDAPGHKSFVPNMIGGAAQADVAVLVISARKGEFETGFDRGGQTREHAMLVKTAGVKHLVVLINKMDDPTVEWSEERYNECKEKLIPFLKKTGFNIKQDVFFLPCSGFKGFFLKDIPDPNPAAPWYTGPSFLQYIDKLPDMNRMADAPVRLPVVEKYKDMGLFVMGKLEAGTITIGDKLTLMPNRDTCEIASILSDEDEMSQGSAGENVKLRLKGVEEDNVAQGMVLCDSNALCHTARTFDAQIIILDHPGIICSGFQAVMHVHTCIEEVTLKLLICTVDKKSGAKTAKPRFVRQDTCAIARFEVNNAVVCLEVFKEYPQLGRFTLRDEGRTVAIGKVLKIVQ